MMNSLMYFSGYQVITVSHMADKVQARTHKKKRINKKWKKRYGMIEIPWDKVLVTDDRKIFCHPKMFEKLKAEIEIIELK